jgi:phage virion morphogenesis protein
MSGAYVKVVGLDKQIGRLKKLSKMVQNPEPHLRLAIPAAERAVKKNFDKGGDPTWPAKADGSPSFLKKSGRLKRSIHGRTTRDTLRVGTGLVYGAIHQFGGKAGRNLAATIPQRPYLKIHPDDKRHIIRLIVGSMQREIGR